MKQILAGHGKQQLLLRELLQRGSIPEAFLFYGPENIGKMILAKRFAHSLIQGVHDLSLNDLLHPDLKILTIEPESKLHTVAKVKEFIEDIHLPPYEGKKKVFLIESAHKMLPAASNMLLKTLEEPALSSQIILIAPSLTEVLPTIASRCCKVNFPPLSQEDIKVYFQQAYALEDSKTKELIYDSLGSLDYAHLLVNMKESSWKSALLNLLKPSKETTYEEKMAKILELEKTLEEEGPLFIEYFFDFILRLFRDITLTRACLSKYIHFENLKQDLQVLSQGCLGSFEYLTKIHEEMVSSFLANVKLRSCLEIFFFRIHNKHATLKVAR
jgi:DNA polymerase-3 subunit delta'